MTKSVWDSVVGQAKAVEQLRQLAVNNVHAYLFVGPEGCGKDEAARAFAAQLITGSGDATSREADLIMRGSFSDVIEVLREGAAVDKDEAEAIIRLATTTPTESKVKVVIVHEVHLMRDSAAARLLKTIEEPSEKVIFILLADQLVPSLATINSRCVVVQFVANNVYRERQDKRPTLSDLRESGALEQDADVVMFLYRPGVYEDDPQRKADAYLNVAKHRAGAIGDVRLVFQANYTRFENFTAKGQ